jgi:hypothetical protein
MARNPVTGHYYPWYRDAVWCAQYGNGEVINVHKGEITVVFEWWEGTLQNKKVKTHDSALQGGV